MARRGDEEFNDVEDRYEENTDEDGGDKSRSKRRRSDLNNDAATVEDIDDDEAGRRGRRNGKQPEEFQIITPSPTIASSGHLDADKPPVYKWGVDTAAASASSSSPPPPSRWPQLMEELLDKIFKLLSPPDWLVFGSVCKPWRSVLIAHRVTPMLVRLDRAAQMAGTKDGPETIAFVPWHDGLRQVSSLCKGLPWLSCSSADGWLAESQEEAIFHQEKHVDTFFKIKLLHPLSPQVRIALPRFTSKVEMLALSSPPTSAGCRVVVHGGVHQNGRKTLATCRVGDCWWDYFGPPPLRVSNMIFHKGKLYVHPRLRSVTMVYDFDPLAKLRGVIPVVVDNPPVSAQFVEAGNELLLVVSAELPDEAPNFVVFMLKDGSWVRVRGIGGRVLLLDDHTSVCLSVKQSPYSGFRANCIYAYIHAQARNYFLIYSMDDESYRKLLPVPDAPYNRGDGLGWWLFRW